MSFVLAGLFLGLLLACLGLHVFGLPGNWLLLALVGLWDFLHAPAHFGLAFYGVLAGLAILGEVVEFGAQLLGAKRYGATARGNVGGFVGALAGALVGAPFFLGFGALIGAVAGAFFGCYSFERLHGRDSAEALQAARGALLGKVFGLAAKTACGVVMWVAAARAIWPA
jgi:uncharacterized protein YqgC (DUF456 family)